MAEPGEPAWIRSLKNGGALPLRDVRECANGWASPSGDIFQVRGPDYIQSKTKIKGGDCLLRPIAFDWIKCSTKIFNVMQHPHGRVSAALGEALKIAQTKKERQPFVWAINLQVPSKENHSLIFYYVSFEQPVKDSLMQRFLDGDDTFRNGRFKLLANVIQGPWIVKKAVGDRAVCLLGKAVTCTYTRSDHFMEIDVDIGASIMANAIVHLAFGCVTSLTVDLAFVIEGQEQSELPERILGTIRFANLDPSGASSLDAPLSDRDKAKHGNFWRSVSNLLHAGHQDSVANVEDDDEKFVHPHS
ncbi:hypothetical protein KP509_35G027500 [Ceratopteris richardii]|uniref:Protein ENHANCED DISEASE RESISTANCE 2 C-terminal domain-containing protein n=1 Tax=Ceratopteris richardii TaxID=49495 RepID=A0A8T2QG17_CERRI|nr:hypothetical protein KP509_35G027500 [Ceratopteris richardii]